MRYKKGNRISFRYKGGRKVVLLVTYFDDKCTIGDLESAYIGKNEEWSIGENKSFNNREMQDIKLI